MDERLDLEPIRAWYDRLPARIRYRMRPNGDFTVDAAIHVGALLAEVEQLRGRVGDLERVANQARLAIAFLYGGCSEQDPGDPEDHAMCAALHALTRVLTTDPTGIVRGYQIAQVNTVDSGGAL